MKVALLGSFPIFPYRHEVRFWNNRPDLTTTWNHNLAKALASTGSCEVHVLTCAPLWTTQAIETDGFTLHFVGHLPKLNWWDYLTNFRYSTSLLHAQLKRIRPDVVHGSGTDHEYAYAATTFPAPSIFTVHGVMREVVNVNHRSALSFDARLASREAWVAQRSQFMIALNRYTERQFPEFRGQVFRISNAISEAFFSVSRAPENRIVFVGQGVRRKRVDVLLEAAIPLLRDDSSLTLTLVMQGGDGPYLQSMQQKVTAEGLSNQVEFSRRLEQAEIADLFGRTKVLVLPSAWENAPMVIAEAQAAGVPVVATKVGGVQEMIDHEENGLLVEPDNPTELRTALSRILADNRLREALAGAGRMSARERYHPAQVAAQTLTAYQEMLRALNVGAVSR